MNCVYCKRQIIADHAGWGYDDNGQWHTECFSITEDIALV